jgi:hypothetical protein
VLALFFLLAAAPADYPAPAVFAAFAAACSRAGDPGANAAALEAAGWTRMSPRARTPLSRMIDYQRQNDWSVDSGTDYGARFRKRVAGRTLYASLTRTQYGGSMTGTALRCAVIDFDATRLVALSELEPASTRQEANATTQPDGAIYLRYEPGLSGAREQLDIIFIPRTARADHSFHGLSLQNTSYVYRRPR